VTAISGRIEEPDLTAVGARKGPAPAEATGLNYETVKHYGSLARAYELYARVQNLNFVHHRATMPAPTAEPGAAAEAVGGAARITALGKEHCCE
jgi:hypothetical protein